MSEYWVLKDKADNTYARLASSEVDVNFWDKDRTEAITFISSARANKEKGRGEYVSTVRVFRVFTKPKVAPVMGPRVLIMRKVRTEAGCLVVETQYSLDNGKTFAEDRPFNCGRASSAALARQILATP